ncbi:MAG: hypothetical protein GKR90_27395 [Pseudomonadales bacterium]|nr:hypothetical protein [Pseudomonadales bacterium]
MTSLESFSAPIGWDRLEGATNSNCIIEIYKSYNAEPHVFLSVHTHCTGFSVKEHAESRTSGPNISEIGVYATMSSALDAMVETSYSWDDHIANIEDKFLKRSADGSEKEHSNLPVSHEWLAIGPGVGLGFGATVGYLINNDLELGISQGVLIGLIVGVFMHQREKKRKK